MMASIEQSKSLNNILFSRVFKFIIISIIGTLLVYFSVHEDFIVETEIPKPTSSFYVNDYSGSLAQITEEFIRDQGNALNEKTTAQVVVSMVPNTGNKTLESYSIDMANNWGIGSKEQNNGVLILFTTEDKPHVRLEVGKGLEGDINDAKAGRILDDYAVPYKDKYMFDAAALSTFAAVARVLYKKYNLEIPSELKAEAIQDQIKDNVRLFVINKIANETIRSKHKIKSNQVQNSETVNDSTEIGDGSNENSKNTIQYSQPTKEQIERARTVADGEFVEPKKVHENMPFFLRLLVSLVLFWIFWLMFKLSNVMSSKRSFGGGYSGGGGSFGGGGASR